MITATVDPSTPETYVLSNTSTITTDTNDPDLDDNTSSTTTNVDTEADLSVTKDAPATATAGDPAGFDYTLHVHNGGPSDNTGGFTVSDTLDSSLTFQTAGSSTRLLGDGPARDLLQHHRPRGQRRTRRSRCT